jgi:hypothetical protein
VRRLLALLAAGLAAAALGAAAAPASAESVLALQDDNLPNLAPGPALNRALDRLAATGTRVTRLDVLWNLVAPTRPANPRDPSDPAYDWSRYDAILRGLRERGISTLVDFYQTPAWATRGGVGQPNEAPRAADGAAFAGALARRYNGVTADATGRGLPEVRRIEVWNEPNFGQFWLPQCHETAKGIRLDSPRAYSALLAASYREIKRANPNAIVIGGVAGPGGDTPKHCPKGGDVSVGTDDFALGLAKQKVPLDAWSQHIYPIGSPLKAPFFPSWSTVPRLQRIVDKLKPGLPIYVTETGYHTSYNRYHRYWVSEAQQATYLDETVQAAARYPRVKIAIWFNLQDNPYWTGGLLRADGSRKPSYTRFLALAEAGQTPLDWSP